MHEQFSLSLPATRFARNTLLYSLLGLLPILVLFVAKTPGFSMHLLNGGPALSRFLRQVLTNGVPVVFTVNYISFFLFAWSTQRTWPRRDPGIVLFIDLPVRIVVFVALHVIIYVLSADWFGSFGGSRSTALKVVAPTLARSALFENISGAYLYATLVSGLPLYVAVTKRSPKLRRLVVCLPASTGPVVLSIAWFAVFVIFLTIIASTIVRWQTSPQS